MTEEKEKEDGKHAPKYLYIEPQYVHSIGHSPPTPLNFYSLKEKDGIDLVDVFRRQ